MRFGKDVKFSLEDVYSSLNNYLYHSNGDFEFKVEEKVNKYSAYSDEVMYQLILLISGEEYVLETVSKDKYKKHLTLEELDGVIKYIDEEIKDTYKIHQLKKQITTEEDFKDYLIKGINNSLDGLNK